MTGDAWTFDPAGAGARVPAIATALIVGLVSGHPVTGVVAASGAYLVGFGASFELHGSRPLLLVAATIGIGVSATLGSIAAAHGWIAIGLVALFGGVGGLAASGDAAKAWIALQCTIAALIATSYPASLAHAAERAALIGAGGLLQAVTVSLAALWRRPAPPPPPGEPLPWARYAVHLAAGLALSTAIERALGMRNGYWMPITTLLVLRPTTRSTMTRALSRSLGTMAGVALASALLLTTRPPPPVLAVLVASAAFGAYTFQRATYGLFSACVGMYVVFILSLAGLPEEKIAVARVVATLGGAGVGLAVQLLNSVRELAPRRAGAPPP